MSLYQNFAYSTVAIAPVPAASGTTLTVATGEGADFPAVPFEMSVCPAGVNPRRTNAETVLVTAMAGDAITVMTRAYDGTSARAIVVGDQCWNAATAGAMTAWTDGVTSVAPSASPSFVGLALSGLTAMRLVCTDGLKALASVALLSAFVLGTTDQIVATDTAGGTITLSLPQNIHTAATPTFGRLTLTQAAVAGGATTLTITSGAHTAVTAEVVDLNIASHTNTVTGAYGTQRFINVGQHTITAASPLNITTAVAMQFGGPPKMAGSATAGFSIGVRISPSASVTSAVTRAVSLWCDPPTGATTSNLAAYFGGRVGVGTFDPNTIFHVIYTNSGATPTNCRALQFQNDNAETVASTANEVTGVYGIARITAGNTQNNTSAIGLSGVVANLNTLAGATGIITNSHGVFIQTISNAASGVTISNAYGARVGNFANSGTITNTYGFYVGDITIGTQTNTPYSFYASDASAYNYFAGNFGIGVTAPAALVHLKAGTATAGTAPLRFNTGTSLTAAVAGSVEFTTDDLFFTITSGAARKAFVLDDGTRLTSGKIPKATTNGRLIDGPTPLAGTTIYYVADSSGGAVTRKLTFTDGILTAET